MRPTERPCPREGERGTVLVISVIIVTFIVVLITDASHIARVEWEAATNADYDLQLEYAVRSGYQIAEAYLRQDLIDSPDVDHFYEEWAAKGGITKELDPSAYGWTDDLEAEGGGSFPSIRILIEDEERKWPLPLVKVGTDTEKEQRKEQLKVLLDEFRSYTNYDLDASSAGQLAEAIISYVTREEDDNSFGATPRPLTKSGLPLTISDLVLIPSMSPDILFDMLDPEDNNRVIPGLINFITLHSDMRININTAPEPVLMAVTKPDDRRVGSDIFTVRESKREEFDSENPELASRSSLQAGARDPRDDPLRDPTGSEGEEEDGELGYWENVDDLRESDIRTLENRIFDDIRVLVTTQSHVFSIWVEAEMEGVRRTRRYLVRRNGPQIVLILSEPVTYPRFREKTQDELDASAYGDDFR